MYDRILFPTDGSQGANAALDQVLDIASTHDSRLFVLNVADTTRDSVTRVGGEVIDTLETAGERAVSEAAERARTRGVDVDTEVRQGRPYQVIVDYAGAVGADVVVMPTHGRTGLERFLLGSTTERVVRRSDVPVLTLQPDDTEVITYPFRDVLVPTDGSSCADAALERAVEIATTEGAALHLLSVVDVAQLGVDARTGFQVDQLESSAEDVLADASSFAAEAGVGSVSSTVEFGASISNTVLDYVDAHDVDVVVAGTHGRTGVDRYLLGSVTEKLVRTSPVPVLTVREQNPDS